MRVLTALGTVAAAAPTWMASYGAPSEQPSLPSPTVDRCRYDCHSLFKVVKIWKRHDFDTPWLTQKFDASRGEQFWVVSLHIFYWHLNQFIDVFNANHSTSGPCLQTTKERRYCTQSYTVFYANLGEKYQVSNMCIVRNMQSLYRTYHPCKAGSEISTSWTHIQCRCPFG